jgi:MtN3 and saliva related transmembrane protein
MPQLVTIIGTIAAMLSVASFAPQAWRIIRTREVDGLSKKTYFLTSLGFAMWTAYGVLQGDWPIIVPNVLCLMFALFILTMLVLPKHKREEVADKLDPGVG